MEFALLGADEHILRLAKAAIDAGHRITSCCEVGDLLSEVKAISPEAEFEPDWVNLVSASHSDAILVATSDTSPDSKTKRKEQLRRLAQAGRPMLIEFPVVEELLFYYELGMIAKDSRGVLASYSPEALHPILQHIGDDVVSSGQTYPDVGPLRRITFERSLEDRSSENVTSQFARDVSILERIVPGLNRMHAIGPTSTAKTYDHLIVDFAQHRGCDIRWQVLSSNPATSNSQFILEHDRGVVTLRLDSDSQWTMESKRIVSNAEPELKSIALPYRPAAICIQSFVDTIESKVSKALFDWGDSTHALELADTIEISLRRARAIDVHAREVDESIIFKGRMASIGCFLLLFIPFVITVLVALDSFFESFRDILRSWHIILLGILLLFLALQLIPMWLIHEKKDDERAA